MPTLQSGPRGTIDLNVDLIAQNMVAKVAQLNPSAGPLTTVVNVMDRYLVTETAEPQHAEDELLPTKDTSPSANTDTTDTTIAVSNPGFYLVGDILYIPRTGEHMRVTSAPGTSPITVTRGWGGPPATIAAGDPIWILGGASEEGDTSRTALNTLEVTKTEYCQVIRNSIDATEIQMATRQLGGDFDTQAEKKLIEHKRQCDNFFKWGVKDKQTGSGGQNVRTMEGLDSWIRTNRMAIDGVLGEGEWDAALEVAGTYGNERKLAIMGPRAYRAINNFAKNRLVTVPSDEWYGLTIQSYVSGGLDVWIVVDQELKGAIHSGQIFIVDPDYLVVRPLIAYDGNEKYQGVGYSKRVENIQANDRAGRKDEWYSCLTLQKIHERTAMVLTGVEG